MSHGNLPHHHFDHSHNDHHGHEDGDDGNGGDGQSIQGSKWLFVTSAGKALMPHIMQMIIWFHSVSENSISSEEFKKCALSKLVRS